VVRITAASPLYSFLLALLTTTFRFIGLLLVGPGTFVIAPLIALIATQGLWVVTGEEIPDLVAPEEYVERQAKRRERQGEGAADSTS
jgi:hypothetical protein